MSTILPALEKHRRSALDELDKLLVDCKAFPINYNHYYTDNITLKRQGRIKKKLRKAVPDKYRSSILKETADPEAIINLLIQGLDGCDPDMEDTSCEEALDCLLAIYKVQQKTFVANVTTQVIERHIVRNLDNIFSPNLVFTLSDSQIENMVSEPSSTKRTRAQLNDRIKRLQEGKDIFCGVVGI